LCNPYDLLGDRFFQYAIRFHIHSRNVFDLWALKKRNSSCSLSEFSCSLICSWLNKIWLESDYRYEFWCQERTWWERENRLWSAAVKQTQHLYN
jgi:hypothetical protein